MRKLKRITVLRLKSGRERGEGIGMEINITKFFNEAEPSDFCSSVAEMGQNAGAYTWKYAIEAAEDEYQFLDTVEKQQAFRDHVRAFGAWTDDQINSWQVVELDALFIQFVSGDIRSSEGLTNKDWELYKKEWESGQCSGQMFYRHDGEIYYQLD